MLRTIRLSASNHSTSRSLVASCFAIIAIALGGLGCEEGSASSSLGESKIDVSGGAASGEDGYGGRAGPIGLNVFVDAMSVHYLEGVHIDYIDGLQESGFKIDNPSATGSCGCGSSFSM